MLMATRDPSLHPGAAPPVGSGLNRLMNVLQVAGALLAIPAGLASAWSIYHANFSVEARCQSLRGNIVSMLDKSADATTLRMLIGHDVKAFEQSCGTVDPDAVAAFKTLLAKKPAVAQSTAKPVATSAVAKSAAAKSAAAKTAEAKRVEEAPAQHESSDAKWLAAVRGALVSHHAEARPNEPNEPARIAPPVTAVPPMQAVAAPLVSTTVVSVPPPVAAVPRTEADHPVPPALIPEATPAMQARTGYRLGALVAHVPLIRNMFAR
jgi:hypothetical protein